jgi:class 3 adenylate cyclase
VPPEPAAGHAVVCPGCGAENPAGFRVCGYCGTPLAPAPGAGRRKLATVLFCDMTGSTPFGEAIDQESLREVMVRYSAAARAVAQRHGGTVEKFIGDAVLAVFGVPVTHEDDALRAVRAGAELRQRFAEIADEVEERFGRRLAVRIGINTGEVVAGDPATGQMLVTGDAVNVAARLEQTAEPGEILLGELTYRLARDSLTAEPVTLALKGKSGEVAAFRLRELAGEAAPAPRPGGALVGREEELAALEDAFEDCVSGRRCRLAVVLGEAGVGKSRLAAAFVARAGERATVLSGRCLSYGEGVTYWPLREALRQAAGLRGGDDTEQARARIARLLPDDAAAHVAVERLATAVGIGRGAASPDEIAWAVRALLESLASERPVVFLVDDLHWAEPVFVDLVEHVLTRSQGAPVLLLASARPELLERRPGLCADDRLCLRLAPLSDEEATRLVDAVPGGAALPGPVRERVLAAAGGNPLFLEELLAMLAERGPGAGDGGAGELAIPQTLDLLLASRLDQLDEDARLVLERASVPGVVFRREALDALLPDGLEAGAALDRLAGKELVVADPASGRGAYRFRHILIRDAAYRALPKRLRAELHETFGDWLEARAGAGRYDELVGFHLERAFRYREELRVAGERPDLGRRAGVRLERAGRAALTRGDLPAATKLLERCAGLLPADDPLHRAALPDLAAAAWRTNDFARAEELLDDAIGSGRRAGDRVVELQALVERALMRLHSDPEGAPAEALRIAEEAIPVCEERGDVRTLAKAWGLIGYVRGVLRLEWAAMTEAALEARAHARRAGDRRLEADLLFGLGLSLLMGPLPVAEGMRRCEELQRDVEGDPLLEAGVLIPLGALQGRLGEFDAGRALIGRARRRFYEVGSEMASEFTQLPLAEMEILAGNYAAVEAGARPYYEFLRQTGEKTDLAGVASLLARAVCAQGRWDEADELARVTEEAASSEDLWPRAIVGLVRTRVLAERGEHAGAEQAGRDLLALLEPTDALELRGDARLELAGARRLAGAEAEARELATDALRLYEQKGNVPAAARAQAFLAALA